MNRKKIIITTVVCLLLIVIGVAWYALTNTRQNSPAENEGKDPLKVSEEAVLKWFNYQNQTKTEYNNPLKPFLTDDFYKETLYVNTERPQDFVGQKPLSSKILSSKIVSNKNGEAVALVEISSKEDGAAVGSPYTVTVNLAEIDGKWLVSFINIEEK